MVDREEVREKKFIFVTSQKHFKWTNFIASNSLIEYDNDKIVAQCYEMKNTCSLYWFD